MEAEVAVGEGGFLGANDGVGEVGGAVRLDGEILGAEEVGRGGGVEGEAAEAATGVAAH